MKISIIIISDRQRYIFTLLGLQGGLAGRPAKAGRSTYADATQHLVTTSLLYLINYVVLQFPEGGFFFKLEITCRFYSTTNEILFCFSCLNVSNED